MASGTLLGALVLLGCSPDRTDERVLYANALDSIDDVLTRTGTTFDATTSSDGHGSIRIEASGPATIRLAEVEPPDAEDAVLVYRGHLRTEDLQGQAYLEMWCSVPGMGEFFSRALHAPLSGTTEWSTQETPFLLEEGQRARTVRLNVVMTGPGVVWVDDVELAQAGR